MKLLITLIGLLLLCGSATAMDAHYQIVVIVYDDSGNGEIGVPVTFADTRTMHTEEDGVVIFDIADLDSVGDTIDVSCKYGVKQAPIVYMTDGVQNCGTAVTFNEPSKSATATILAAMGFTILSAIGGGIYILRKKIGV